jgi:hypothetical protein
MMNEKAKARQNLLVATVNAALKQKLITLDCEPVVAATFQFELGGLPVIASVSDAGFDEVSVKAIVAPTELGRRLVRSAVHYEFRKFGEATVFAWLERRSDKYLQSAVNFHSTKAVKAMLAALSVEPLGFGTRPTKHGYDWHKECEHMFGK